MLEHLTEIHRTPLGTSNTTLARNDPVSEQLANEVTRNIKALDKFIGGDGFAYCDRITLADWALCLDSSL